MRKAEEEDMYTPIASLTETQRCRPIKGQITSVSSWMPTKIGTRYSNFVLRDSSGEIRGKIYGPRGPKFEKMFTVGAILIVERAAVEIFNQYDPAKTIYELCIKNSMRTIKIEEPENADEVGNNCDTRVLIRDVIEKIEPEKCVDIIGILTKVGNVQVINHGDQKLMNRDLKIMDESEMEITVTIWREMARDFKSPVGSVMAFSKVVVRLRPGTNIKNVTFQINSKIEIDVKTDTARRLKDWWEQYSHQGTSHSLVTPLDSSRSGKSQEYQESKKNLKTILSIKDVIQKIEPQKNIDVMGIITKVGDLQVFNHGNQQMINRDLKIIDESEMEIAVTIWRETAENFKSPVGSVVAFNEVAVRLRPKTNIKNLTFHTKSKIEIDPKTNEAKKLRDWWEQYSRQGTSYSLVTQSDPSEYVEQKKNFGAEIREYQEANKNLKTKLTIKDVIERVEPQENIDVMGIITQIGDLQIFNHGSQQMINRDLKIIDESETKIAVTIWRKMAEDFKSSVGSVVAFSEVAVRFRPKTNIKNLTFHIKSRIEIDPQTDEAKRLKDWWEVYSLQELSPTLLSPLTLLESSNESSETINNTRLFVKDVIEKIEPSACVDITGIITEVGPIEIFTSSDRQMINRDLKIIDESEMEIIVTIWREMAKTFKSPVGSIIAFHRVYVCMHPGNNTKNLTTRINSRMEIEPKTDAAESLQNWQKMKILKNITNTAVTSFESLEHGEKFNIIGVLREQNEAKIIENQHCYDHARIIEIVDSKGEVLILLLWGETARDFNAEKGSVIYATNVKIKKHPKVYGALTSHSCIEIHSMEFLENINRMQSQIGDSDEVSKRSRFFLST